MPVPKSVGESMKLAELLSCSTMVPTNYQGRPSDVMVALMMGAEIGLKPMQALQNIACINGRPSVFGDALIAIVYGSNLCEYINEETNELNGVLTASCTTKRSGHEPITRTFSVEDAKVAGLWTKSGPWTTYPGRMLQMRARSICLRDAYPDVLKGIYVAEEAMDIPPEPRNITPTPEVAKVEEKKIGMSSLRNKLVAKADKPVKVEEAKADKPVKVEKATVVEAKADKPVKVEEAKAEEVIFDVAYFCKVMSEVADNPTELMEIAREAATTLSGVDRDKVHKEYLRLADC